MMNLNIFYKKRGGFICKMKKLFITIILIFIFTISYAEIDVQKYQKQYWYLKNYQQKGYIKFIISSGHYYDFKIHLNDKQYVFFLKGKYNKYSMSIIESSGYEYEKIECNRKEIIRFENIMEKGYYIIRIYNNNENDNFIDMKYGEY